MKHQRLIILALLALLAGLLSPLRASPIHAQESGEGCFFTATNDVPLYLAPVLVPEQQRDILPAGLTVAVRLQAPEYLYVELDHAYGGYVNRTLGTLSGACSLNIPVDSGPLHAHPSLCAILTGTPGPVLYDDSARLHDVGQLNASGSYPVTRRVGDSLYVYLGIASGGWIANDAGTLSGNCATLGDGGYARPARARADARLWSQPDVTNGDIVATLAPGSAVTVIAGPVVGPIRQDTGARGDWYQVQQESLTGWLWVGRLDFIISGQTATVLDEARAWTQPDVFAGLVSTTLTPGEPVQILAGPVIGPIRFDDANEVGAWYQVGGQGVVYGWVWSGRLVLSAE